MTPERWQIVDKLFHDALEYEPDQRSAFLARACAGDLLLLGEVESLILFHDQSNSFIEGPASDVAAELFAKRKSELHVGEQIAYYTIRSLLGAGGMGEVYLAEDLRLGRPIALKLLPAQFTAEPERVRRFEQEARTASALNHPNIVTVHEIGKADSTHFIAAEFIDGHTLREHIAGRALRLNEVLDIAIQVASALAAAHGAGVVHRDIKPENVMLRRDGIVKVLDFGLAKLALPPVPTNVTDSPTKLMVHTNPGMVLGTVRYMSPEQARGQEVDARTDLWSLGVMLYEMLTGRAPFAGETPSHLIVSILESDPPSVTQYAQVPAELDRIVTKALRKKREERFQTASDLAIDLKSLKQELEVEARLRRLRPDSENVRISTKSDNGAVAEAFYESNATTDDVGTARTASSAEYLVGEIKRHKRGALLASAAVIVAVAVTIAYLFYPARSAEAIDSVAVLPFVNVSGDPDSEYLSDGISDGIINILSRLPKMRVISLNSVLRYKGQQIDPQAVGRELDVRAVLMGRLTRQGDDLAISTELVDVRDDRRLWGEQYSRKLSSIFAVQGEIARQISEGLRLRLSVEEKKQLAKRYTENSEAYELYLSARYNLSKQTKQAFEESIGLYEQAIEKDPKYALAYIRLADCYYSMWNRGLWTSKDSAQRIEWAALKALELDDTLSEGHTFLGIVKYTNFDWAGAEKEIKRALELDPNSSLANIAYFGYLSIFGKLDQAVHYAKRAVELDPMSYPGGLAHLYFVAHQYDKAIELYLKTLEANSDKPLLHSQLGETYLAIQMYDKAIAEIQKAVALDNAPERWDRHPLLAYAYAMAGRRDEALRILAEQKLLAKQGNISPYNFAIIYTGLGDRERAFEWLEKGYEQRTPYIYRIKIRPMFDSLRSDPRYAELLLKMNLAP
jgi:serine/threonine-protein kinase